MTHTLRMSIGAALVATALFALAPAGASAQSSGSQSGAASSQNANSWLDVTINVPVTLTNLHPEITHFTLDCVINPNSNPGARTFADVEPATQLTTNSFSGTVAKHWHIHSPEGVTAGAVWTYGCGLTLELRAAVNGVGGASVNQSDFTQATSGTGWVTGQFTLQ